MEELFWADQMARTILKRERDLNRDTNTYRTEMGIGASGVPHIGSAGDGIRSYVVSLALQEQNVDTEFVAFSDDRDGLRRVPAGFPATLGQDVGKPVSLIDDPFGCHGSFGEHVSSLLVDAFEKLGVTFLLRHSHEEYAKGTFDNEIMEILRKHKQAGEIIKKITGQDKYLHQLPFLPICQQCGRVYTTRATAFDGTKIHYTCDISFTGKTSTGELIHIDGCGYEGQCGIRDGKLAWKVEFACRWRALGIHYEAYGKDILDSVRCNDAICSEILDHAEPLHSFYELFTERSGRKISKSAGNVFTPQMWLRYASSESMRLLFLKKLATARVVDPDAIPAYMDEVDDLADVYFGKKKVANPTDLAHLRRLYEYVHFLKPPRHRPPAVRYQLLVNLMQLAKNSAVVLDILQRTGHVSQLNADEQQQLLLRIQYVTNWIADTGKDERADYVFSEGQRHALSTLAAALKHKEWDEESLTAFLFELSRKEGLRQNEFFEAAYSVLLNNTRGPRLSHLILALDPRRVADVIEEKLSRV